MSLSANPNSTADAAEAAGGTGNLPVPAGYQPAGPQQGSRREIVRRSDNERQRHSAGW